MLHGHLDYLARQIFVDTADTEHLDRFATVYGLARKPAEFASGTIEFTGTAGSEIPAGTVLQRADGTEYETDAVATIASGVAQVAVTCLSSGDEGNADTGTVLSLGSPIAGVSSSATALTPGLTGGAAVEDDNSLRERILARIQNPPRGGSASDYEAWALSIDGIDRAFIFSGLLGAGTVQVYVLTADPDNPVPSAPKIAEVQAYIDTQRPVTASVLVLAPVPEPIDFEIDLSPNTAEIRAAVEAELKALLVREGSVGGTILRTHIAEVISGSAGEVDHELIVPAGNVTVASGAIPVLGTVTFGTLV